MRILWSRKAISDLKSIREYIAKEKPQSCA